MVFLSRTGFAVLAGSRLTVGDVINTVIIVATAVPRSICDAIRGEVQEYSVGSVVNAALGETVKCDMSADTDLRCDGYVKAGQPRKRVLHEHITLGLAIRGYRRLD